jgi:hypothetical protein
MIKLVVSRFAENVFWVHHIPENCSVLIYNKNNKPLSKIKCQIIDLENVGRESHTYLHHIVVNYEKLDDITIFCQGDPFEHNSFFDRTVAEIASKGMESQITPMTYQWKHNHPPFEVIFDRRSTFYLETISRFNMCPLRFLDANIVELARAYRQVHLDLKDADDLIQHFCKLIKLPDKPDKPTHNFFYSGCFAVKKEAILKHSKDFYQRCIEVLLQNECHGYMFERIWYKMFGGEA